MNATMSPPKVNTGLAIVQNLVNHPQLINEETLQQETNLDPLECTQVMAINKKYLEMLEQLNFHQNEQNKEVLTKQKELQLLQLKNMQESGNKTAKLVEELKESLIDNATGTLGAYKRVIAIYTTAFLLGVALMITAVVFGAMGKTVLAVAFGTIGLIDIVTYFFKMPASQIQESRSNLSQLQVVLLVWMKDLINNEAISGRLINVAEPKIDDYQRLADINIVNTEKLLRLIQELAEPKS